MVREVLVIQAENSNDPKLSEYVYMLQLKQNHGFTPGSSEHPLSWFDKAIRRV